LALNAGVDAIGLRYSLLAAMMQHPLSRKAEILFGRNWANVKGENVDYIHESNLAEGTAE